MTRPTKPRLIGAGRAHRSALPRRRLSLTVCSILAGGLAACASFRPVPLDDVPFRDRAQTETREQITVTVAVPSAEETRRLFDAKLYKKRMQPVWIEVENHSEKPAWIFPYTVDPDYFPPLEAAWKSHRTWAGSVNHRIDVYFYEQALPTQVPAGEVASGFVFVGLDRGVRHVPLAVFQDETWLPFDFIVPVPGFRADHDAVDFRGLYAADEVVELESEADLQRWIEALPCCTSNKKGTRTGDPLNFVLVATEEAFAQGLVRAGWDETAPLSTASSLRMGTAAVFGRSYRYAPMSPLYLYGRAQDIGLQKARWNVHQRNHLRLWLAPARYGERNIWIGQISRDIGTRFTSKSPTFTTHKIDPDVDEARDFLILDLLAAQALEAFAYCGGVGRASADSPHQNLTGDPFFTDGRRAVLLLPEKPLDFNEVDFLDWGAASEGTKP